jgi:hypothetical protein
MQKNQAAYVEWGPEPESYPDVEYDLTPTNWSWLDYQFREVRKRKELTFSPQPILRLVPLFNPITPEKPVLQLVPRPEIEREVPARAKLTFYVQGILELCKSDEVHSWDLLPVLWSLKRSLREMRRKEKRGLD